MKRLKVGEWMTKDVGRKGHHYLIAKKTKKGWSHTKLKMYKRKKK